MGDKKKKRDKDKKKDKKKEKEEKKKNKKKYNSDSDSDSSDDSDSSSSSSSKEKIDKTKRREKSKGKKIKKEKKKSKKDPSEKETPGPASFPYDFNSIPVTLPVIKGLNIPAMPPPAPSAPTTTSVPKPRSKEPNIFKLLPKLPYGSVLFAKMIFSNEYLSEDVLNQVVMTMTKIVEQTTKEEQHKKGISTIAKCKGELEKILKEEKE